MRNAELNAHRWIEQAQFDLETARKLLADGNFSYAAFSAEQSAQKALKAFLLVKSRKYLTIHSVGELAGQAAAFEPKFKALGESAKRLDRHYLASRYPDALPEPAIPATSYTREEAEEAVQTAERIMDICTSVMR